MQVDSTLIAYLEDLSCLVLSDDEKNRIAGDLGKIINAMNKLSELDTQGVCERSHSFDNVNAFRADEAKPSFDRGLLLKNAAEQNNEMFMAPKTVD